MSDKVFSRLQPDQTILLPEQMNAWCDATTAYNAAISNARALLSAAQNAYNEQCLRGYQEGCDKAAGDMAQRLLSADQAVAKILQDLEQNLPSVIADVVDDIFGRLDISAVLPHAIRHTLTKIRQGTLATLRVAPDCAELIRPVLAELPPPGIQLETDPYLPAGRCVLESELGVAELGIKAQLAVLRDYLTTKW
ncbi:type III secretion system stator protein SctL [Acetobacter thailandicus]|uniref:type III secretion system stator protein SctL n=1 Tax=Acetobacter thailandicus TaxID=1502842 RepID=UPI001BA8F97D|nr:type III secretion system stator protein SctL [Acetobacter thailandicus]MBS0960428.1 type III secretion system stator protein SctL [Acetobacter thailandicus]MBS1004337.1 type III secretion system stator protein SctL [Acetobacter thailandicus]